MTAASRRSWMSSTSTTAASVSASATSRRAIWSSSSRATSRRPEAEKDVPVRAEPARAVLAARPVRPLGAGSAFAAGASVVLLAALALAFYWVPSEADQGFSQRILYLHVPIALTAYTCFAVAAWKALRLLSTGDERYDLASY